MAPSDPMTQMNTYRSYVTMLADPNAKDESKLKAAQEMSENFEVRSLLYIYIFFLILVQVLLVKVKLIQLLIAYHK